MKTVLITGASRGIGRAAALEFAKNGWQVAVNYNKSETTAKELCDEIAAFGGFAKPYQADVSDNSQVLDMVDAVIADYGSIDALVNNAGIALGQGLFTDFTDDDDRRIFNTNVFGMMNCSRAIIPHFVGKKCGRIINISSVWGITGGSCEVIYSASKAAVIGFTKALAKELAPSGICVNCIAPGFIDTDMNAHLAKADIEAFCEEIPLGRTGKAEEVAKSIYFLASSDASYITGQVLTVDGGLV